MRDIETRAREMLARHYRQSEYPPMVQESFNLVYGRVDRREQAALGAIGEAMASPWIGIETAPKDGTWIIICKAGRDEVLIAFWHRLMGAWWGQGGSDGQWEKWEKATHWMPIPAIPGVK